MHEPSRSVSLTLAFALVALGGTRAHSQGLLTLETKVGTYSGGASEYDEGRGSYQGAHFLSPHGITFDGEGLLYVADFGNGTVRKINQHGWAITIAGLPQAFGSVDGVGTSARLMGPWGIVRDGAGFVYVTDLWDHTIRKISPEGYVTTLCGLSGNPGSADGPGATARFRYPKGIGIDSLGNLYVADSGNSTIRKITPSGEVSTLAGTAQVTGLVNGSGAAARFSTPNGVTVDASDNVFVADYGNHVVRKITAAGDVSTFAGTGTFGSVDGPHGTARLAFPDDLAFDGSGLLYVIDNSGMRLRTVTPQGAIASVFWAESGNRIGPPHDGSTIAVRRLAAVALSPRNGEVTVTDAGNNSIRRLYRDTYFGYSLPTVAGPGGSSLSGPSGVAINNTGTIFVADQYRHRVVSLSGTEPYVSVHTLAGTGSCTVAVGTWQAGFCYPRDVVVDSYGTLLVSDVYSVRKVTPAGAVSLFVSPSSLDAAGQPIGPIGPRGIAIDLANTLYIADTGKHRILKVSPGGVVSVLAGSTRGYADGPAASALFAIPYDVAVDIYGTVYVADYGNSVIRRIGVDGSVTTLAGQPEVAGFGDGQGAAARFRYPQSVAVDADGNLLVGDGGLLRRVSQAGLVTTVAGASQPNGSQVWGYADGTGSEAHLHAAQGITPLPAGRFLIADAGADTIRVAYPSIADSAVGASSTVVPPASLAVSAQPVTATSFEWSFLLQPYYLPGYGLAPYLSYALPAIPDREFGCGALGIYRLGLRASAAAGVRRSTLDINCAPSARLTVDDVRVMEGNSTTRTARVRLSLSAAQSDPIAATVSTQDVSAGAGSDYDAVAALVVTFAPGETVQWVNVNVRGDTDPEPKETAQLLVQSVTGPVSIQDGIGEISILNDDAGGEVSISAHDTSAPEGYTGSTTLQFPVTLSAPSSSPVSVNCLLLSGYYTITPTTLVFAPGETRKIVTASVSGADTNDEDNQNYPLRLEAPVGASLADDTADGVILNDDGPLYAVTDARVVEGTGGGPRYLAFTVTRSVAGPFAGMVSFRTVAGTATEFEDYVPKSGVIAFPVGLQSASVRVPVFPDAVIEADETLFLRLSMVKDRYESRGTVFDGEGVGTIASDDGLLLSIGDRTGEEGNVGTTPLSFAVTLSAAPASPVTVDWETADGSATAPLDYAAASGTLVFGPGETTRTITVQILGDTGEESYETLFVNLKNPTGGATIARGQGQGTITNTDGSTDRSRLMFHNFVTNRLYRWHMKNGNALDTYNWVTPWATDAGWTVGAVADFDQDGQLDYLWHNVNDGRLLFWYIDGDNLKGYQFLPYLAEPPWRVAATFDGNGDGTADLVYYNQSTGVVRVRLHDNATSVGSYDLLTNLAGAGSTRIVAAGDANNDGDDELILYDSATGRVSAWDVLGPNLQGTTLYPTLQSTLINFTLVSTKTDFNDDGLPDFLWHNPTPTGVFSVWFMNGTTRLGQGTFQPFTATDPVWRVVGSANVW